MGKRIYLVRHCQAEGQEFDAPLTETGKKQAEKLAKFFSTIDLDSVISSPYHRAIQSVTPLTRQKELELKLDDRLSERVLSAINLDDWQEKLETSFQDLDVTYQGGESSREAMARGLHVLEEVCQGSSENILIATHGNLMALMISHFSPGFGFDGWKTLQNPDVYLIEIDSKKSTVDHLWDEKKDVSHR